MLSPVGLQNCTSGPRFHTNVPRRNSTPVQEPCPGSHSSPSPRKAHLFLNMSPRTRKRTPANRVRGIHTAARALCTSGYIAHMRSGPQPRPLATRGVPNDRRGSPGAGRKVSAQAPRVGEVNPGREDAPPGVSLTPPAPHSRLPEVGLAPGLSVPSEGPPPPPIRGGTLASPPLRSHLLTGPEVKGLRVKGCGVGAP